jgi:drug/metabolite transporter (DMT)-like permease
MSRGALYALAAAALFGASTPFAKLLLGGVGPVMLAGLLYAGSGLGLGVVLVARALAHRGRLEVAWPRGGDIGWLAAAVAFGGIAGPVLLLIGLTREAASSASLLLNLEAVFTALLAWFVFHENVDRRVALGMLSIVAGALVLATPSMSPATWSSGALMIASACLCWAIDNNLTRKASGSDAIVVAGIKGIAAGATNLVLAAAIGEPWPRVSESLAAGALGFAGYGVSLALFVVALRELGTARTGAYFSVAPFFGAVVAIAMLGDAVTMQLVAAAVLMACGVYLHLTERHAHEHRHEPLVHTHAHRHDEHHTHQHGADWNGAEPHVHEHEHPPLTHSHPHVPDLHHRHRH